MIKSKDLVKRFIRYVKVDSLSKQEGRFSRLLKKELSLMGLKPLEDNAWKALKGESGNIFASLKGNLPGAPRILLNAHIDTVMPGIGIKPRIKGGFVLSDGTTVLGADNKAGVAVIMEVIQNIRKLKILHGEIDIVFTVAEEIGLSGSKFTDKNFLKADFGYVLDGGDVDEIINKAPSQDSLDIRITGRAAHAGVHPEQGINAIKVASEAISTMNLGRIDNETTANIGIISGGIATNIVPETVTIRGEARSHNINKLRRQVSRMKSAFSKACAKHGASLRFDVTPTYRAFEIPETRPVLVIAKNAARAIGIKPTIRSTGGGSDANIFSGFGMECVIIGVGAHNVHTKKERISVSQMALGAEYLISIIKESARWTKRR